MLSRHVNKLLRYARSRVTSNYRGFASANVEADSTERDPTPFFFDKEVQAYLKTLTTLDIKKVFRIRKDGHKLKPPVYKFLTDEEVEVARSEGKLKIEQRLQMPPVVKQRLDPSEPLCKDPGLQNHDEANSTYVFTDITFDLSDRERSVVIREPEGTLRHATWKERDRILQIYFPRPGKMLQKPKMFEGEYLKSLLERNEYEFILDRACVQLEPDDPDYQAVTREVYEYINIEKHFDTLRSTRHFGPMVFHLVWTRNIENLLCEMIERGRIEDAALLIRLYHKIHPTTKSAVERFDGANDIEFILHYAHHDSSKRGMIEKLVQSYEELQRERRIVEEGIEKAHGVSSKSNEM